MPSSWKHVDWKQYYAASLELTGEERARLEAALDVLPTHVIDAHTHIARERDIVDLCDELLGQVVTTFPVYTLEMAARAREVLWPGKVVRSARMAHAVAGYRFRSINRYLSAKLPRDDLLIAFGDPCDQSDIIDGVHNGTFAALKMYFRATSPPRQTVRATFSDEMLEAAALGGVPVIVHLPRSLPTGLAEVVELAQAHPSLVIILAHVGGQGGQPLEPGVREALAELSDLPNISVDTALVFDARLIEAALETMGPDHVLFGTDEPLSLIRAVSYLHPRLGPRLFGPQYHWAASDDAVHVPPGETAILLHILQVEAVVAACGSERQTMRAVFHDNAARLMLRSP